jgi:signal transduction histidine kinase
LLESPRKRGEFLHAGGECADFRISTERRNREAEKAQHAAESANRAKSRFLAMMSHELRTPLNAIIGFSDLMRNQSLGPMQPAKYREYAGDIHVSGQNLQAVINDILDMAKIEDGKMVLFEEAIDLGEQIFAATRFVAERARQSQIALDRAVAPGLPLLLADQRSVRHILHNLLAKAVKFTPGGGRVTVRAKRTADRGLELAVADTGIGMSPEHLEIALTRFGQVANEYTRQHDGTGLGLPLVKSLAELHGAALRIDSALGTGTTVRIAFPPQRVLEQNAELPAPGSRPRTDRPWPMPRAWVFCGKSGFLLLDKALAER